MFREDLSNKNHTVRLINFIRMGSASARADAVINEAITITDVSFMRSDENPEGILIIPRLGESRSSIRSGLGKRGRRPSALISETIESAIRKEFAIWTKADTSYLGLRKPTDALSSSEKQFPEEAWYA